MAPIHGSGYQQDSGAVHPSFPDQGDASEADVRRRAYELWEADRHADGGHERHWLQAEQELRRRS